MVMDQASPLAIVEWIEIIPNIPGSGAALSPLAIVEWIEICSQSLCPGPPGSPLAIVEWIEMYDCRYRP